MSKLIAQIKEYNDADLQRLILQTGGPALFNSGEYALQITSLNSAAAVTLGVRYHAIDVESQIIKSQDTHTPATNRTATTTIVRLPVGWVYGGSVFVTGGSPLTGNCYVIVDLVVNDGGASTVLRTLAAGYVSAQSRLFWPSGLYGSPQDGAGALRSIAGTNPGAGNEISETVPSGARWHLLSFNVQFAPSGVAGNRFPALILDDGTTRYGQFAVQAASPASTTRQLTWAQGVVDAHVASNATGFSGLPNNIRMGPGHRIRTSTAGLDVGDAFTAIQYNVLEWLEA